VSEVLITRANAIARITLNRPDKLNAMNASLTEALIAAVTQADAATDVAVIVIAGAGRAFCAGADIRGAPPASDVTARDQVAAKNRTLRLYKTLLEINTPMIAEVQGYALGGGCNIAMSSDLVVAADNAVFGYPELKVGLAATAVTPPLVHQIGRKAAFELLTLCENIDAERALQLGMINRVVPAADLSAQTLAMAERLASFDHDALWMTKQTIRRSAAMPVMQALEMARDTALGMKVFD
jgi:enoyl-CoA hydratase